MAESKRGLLTLPGACGALLALCGLSLAQAACTAGFSLSLAWTLAEMWAGAGPDTQYPFFALVFGLFLGRQWIGLAQESFASRYARARADELREQLLHKAFVDQTRTLHSEGSAALAAQAIEGVAQVERYLELMLPKIVGIACITLPLLVLAFALDWVSGIILVVVFPVVGLFMVMLGGMAREYAQAQFEEYNRLSNSFIDTLRGLGTLQAFGAAKAEEGKVFTRSERFREATMRTLRVATTSGAALDLICVLGLAAIAIMLAFRLMDGSLGLFIGLACLILAPEVTNPLRAFAADFHASLDGSKALDHLLKLVAGADDAEAEGDAVAGAEDATGDGDDFALPAWTAESTLEFENVSFSYLDESRPEADGQPDGGTRSGDAVRENACCTFSLKLSGFEHVGVIGPSGSGKSTLAALLGGFELPQGGTIRINGREVDDLRSPAWQSQVLFIPQNPSIFHASLRDNLAFYTPDATDEEVAQAVRTLGLDALIAELPEGLEAIIGEGGRGLSGGQAQRVALARALLDRSRRILIFDEPTAHLDVETELELKERMLPLMEDRLVVFCTHRLHWLGQMDRSIELATPRSSAERPAEQPCNRPAPRPQVAVQSAKESRRGPLSAIGLGVLGAVFSVLLMFTAGFLICRTAEPGTLLIAIMTPIAFVQLFGIGRPLARYFQRLAAHDWVFRLTSRLRAGLYRAFERSATAFGFSRSTGDALGLLAEDIGHLQNLFLRIGLPFAIAMAVCLLTTIALAFADGAFAAFALFAFFLLVAVIPLVGRRASKATAHRAKEATDAEYDHLTDDILGRADWVLSGRGEDCVRASGREHAELQQLRSKVKARVRLADAAQTLVLAAAAAATLAWAANAFAAGRNWIAAFAIGFFPLVEFLAPLPQSAAGLHAYRESLERLGVLWQADGIRAFLLGIIRDKTPQATDAGEAAPSEELRRDSHTQAPPHNDRIQDCDGDRGGDRNYGCGRDHAGEGDHASTPSWPVALRNVDFTYPEETRAALSGVSLEIAAGEHVAVLGRSGAGKSTLAGLVCGDLTPARGDVLVGGGPAAARVQNGKRSVGVLHQQAYLFNRTLRENLTLGVLDADDEELLQALRAVELESLVRSLPYGLDTVVEEGGGNFSGGERQRIALARLLLADTPVVLLDEPFTALDPVTEDALLDTLLQVFAQRTLIVISHHLRGIERFDRAVFVENGRVELDGAPAVLVRESPRFERLLAFDHAKG